MMVLQASSNYASPINAHHAREGSETLLRLLFFDLALALKLSSYEYIIIYSIPFPTKL